MTRGPHATLLAPLLLAACASAPPLPPPAPPPAPVEWDRELPPEVRVVWRWERGPGRPSHSVARVVDGDGGGPVAGARIDNWWEADTPLAEPWEDLLEQSAVTDGDGYAVVRRDGAASWFYVEAPGYGPRGEMGSFLEDRSFPLRRGADRRILVLDGFDRPVPGAALDYMLGCGHTPFVRWVETGADGVAVLPCIDPGEGYLWVHGDGLEGYTAAYNSSPVSLERLHDIPVLRCDPGPVLEGRVLYADGTPAADAAVGTKWHQRGPWTTTDAGGRYRLVGAAAWARLTVYAWPPPGAPEGAGNLWTWFDSVPGVAPTVRLPAPEEIAENGEVLRKEGEVLPTLRVRVLGPRDGPAVDRVRVVLVREGDGRAWVETVPMLEGEADRTFDMAPGRWRVTAGNALGRLRPGTETVTVGEPPFAGEVEIRLEENPTWRPRILRATEDGGTEEVPFPWPGTLLLRDAVESVEAVPVEGEPGAVHCPAEGEFAAVYLDGEGGRALVVMDGPPAGRGPGLLPVPEEGGRWVEEEEEEATAPPDCPAVRLRVLLPDGSPAAGAEVHLAGRSAFHLPPREDPLLDADGTAVFPAFAGTEVEVEPPAGDLPPLTLTVDGPGPFTLRWPDAEVVVRAAAPDGTPIPDFAVLFRGDTLAAADGAVRLRGRLGPLRLWVEADGRRVRDLRIVLKEGDRRALVAILNPTQSGDETGEYSPQGDDR